MHVEHLAILERVEDDSEPDELLRKSVQRARPMRARMGEPAEEALQSRHTRGQARVEPTRSLDHRQKISRPGQKCGT